MEPDGRRARRAAATRVAGIAAAGWLVLAVLSTAALVADATAAERAPDVERLAVAIAVGLDGSLAVRESVVFAADAVHRGVHRVIPVRRTRDGAESALRIDRVRVLDSEFRPAPAEILPSRRDLAIRARLPDGIAEPSTLTIAYRVWHGLVRVDDRDALEWNVTGDLWEAPIRRVEATVVTPVAVPADDIRSIAYAGQGTAAGAQYAPQRAANMLVFRTTRPLRPREPLTIRVAWPAGIIGRPSAWQSLAWAVEDTWPAGLPILTAALCFIGWRRHGRDPMARLSVAPRYRPPTGLAPAEAGALLTERLHATGVVATIVDLAVRGYLRVELITRADGEPDYLLRRLRPILGDVSVRPFELFVLAKVFDTDWALNLRLLSEVRLDYDTSLPAIADEIDRTMVARRLFPSCPERLRRAWRRLGLAIVVAGALTYAAPPAWAASRAGALGTAVALSGAVIAAFAPVMPKRTWTGAEMLAEVRGFREFLERAEKDRLERLPPDTLHRWLSWAIALGVTERWIRRFDGLRVDEPAWYAADAEFSVTGYQHAVAAFTRRTEQAIRTAARPPAVADTA